MLHYAARMARPRGRSKPARLTVNLEEPTYASLVRVAKREDVSVSWVVRRAIKALLASDQKRSVGPEFEASLNRKDSMESGQRPAK